MTFMHAPLIFGKSQLKKIDKDENLYMMAKRRISLPVSEIST